MRKTASIPEEQSACVSASPGEAELIHRRRLLQSACAWLLPGVAAHAAERIAYREYARCLPDYLASLAADAYRRRNDHIAKLTTPAAIRAYQQWSRETLLKLIGGLPERTPLNVRT